MIGRILRARALGPAGIVLLVASLPASADRLHLDGGGVIETPRWWVEGDTLIYENAVGTVGLPRSIVVKIEPTETTRRYLEAKKQKLGHDLTSV